MLARIVKFQNVPVAQATCAFTTSSVSRALENVKMWIDGEKIESETTRWIDLTNPATGDVIGKIPLCTKGDLKKSVDSAKEAFKSWRWVSPIARTEYMYSFRSLIRRDIRKLSEIITLEHGKTLSESENEIQRGLQVVDHACSAPTLLMGEHLRGLGTDVDTKTMRVPLGVCASITPFNFPSMFFLWTVPLALVTGNTVVVKPSEQNPGATTFLVELLKEAGIPDGCVNVVHGEQDSVDFLCDHPDIKAISFVGGNRAGEHIFERATKLKKRAQCNMGAKCLSVIMPDAHKESTIKRITSGAYGSSGQRCLALSTAILVGEAKEWIPEIVADAQKFQVGNGCHESVDFGPLISSRSKKRCLELIESATKDGCQLLLDGRSITVPGHEKGYFVGPTVLGGVKEHMRCYREEIFGPVLSLMTADTLDEAIDIVNRNEFGNGTTLFTNSGSTARRFSEHAEPGLMGVNIPIPIAMPMFAFTGNKLSFAGDCNFLGKSGVHFYTQIKTITSLWRRDDAGRNIQSENFKR